MISGIQVITQPTSLHSLGGDLLDTVHGIITEDVKADLADKGVTTMQDGWSDFHNTPVIVSSDRNSYFVSATTLERTRTQQINASALPETIDARYTFVCTVAA